MEEILVSVIVPVFNAEHFLNDCISSILKQTYDKFELLLINDGSTDGSLQICEEYKKNDSRIRVFNEENHGVSYARNLGISKAQGDYITFIDSDDFVSEEYIFLLLNKLDNNDCVYAGYNFYYDKKTVVQKIPRLPEGKYKFVDVEARIIDDGTLTGILFGSVCSCLYKRALIDEFGIRFVDTIKRNEDGIFNIEYLKHAASFVVSHDALYYYRQWKTKKIKTDFIPDIELTRATEYIVDRYSEFEDFELQINRRRASVIFWNLLTVGTVDLKSKKLKKRIKDYVSESEFEVFYQSLDLSKISIYKKVLAWLISKKKFGFYLFLVRSVKPILEKRLRH